MGNGVDGIHPTRLQGDYLRVEIDPAEKAEQEAMKYVQEHRNEIILKKNDSKAASIVNDKDELPHITVDGEEYIAAGDFNKYVKEHYPNAEFNEVVNYISLENAMISITYYIVQQQIYDISKKAAQLKKETGHDKAPDVGV